MAAQPEPIRVHIEDASPQEMIDELERRGARAAMVFWKEGKPLLRFTAPEGGGRADFEEFRSALSAALEEIQSAMP